jgi:hypothetical protein
MLIEYTAIQNLYHELAHAMHMMKGSWCYFASEKQAGDHCLKSGLCDHSLSPGSLIIAAIVLGFMRLRFFRSRRNASI